MLNGRTISDTPAHFTYVGPSGKSIIDLWWINSNLIESIYIFEVSDVGTLSDHLPVRIVLKLKDCWRGEEIRTVQSRETQSGNTVGMIAWLTCIIVN